MWVSLITCNVTNLFFISCCSILARHCFSCSCCCSCHWFWICELGSASLLFCKSVLQSFCFLGWFLWLLSHPWCLDLILPFLFLLVQILRTRPLPASTRALFAWNNWNGVWIKIIYKIDYNTLLGSRGVSIIWFGPCIRTPTHLLLYFTNAELPGLCLHVCRIGPLLIFHWSLGHSNPPLEPFLNLQVLSLAATGKRKSQ